MGEYLENAVKFERTATEATDPKLKEAFAGQAKAYRNMAIKRAKMLGLPAPSPPENRTS